EKVHAGIGVVSIKFSDFFETLDSRTFKSNLFKDGTKVAARALAENYIANRIVRDVLGMTVLPMPGMVLRGLHWGGKLAHALTQQNEAVKIGHDAIAQQQGSSFAHLEAVEKEFDGLFDR